MKKFILVFLLFVCSVFLAFSQCPVGDVVFYTQEEIDAFGLSYPDCTEMKGSIYVKGRNSYISNLTGLQNLVSIDGTFTIENAVFLPSLVGLENLESVGRLRITNTAIANLVGLQNLRSIAFLTIANNILLVDILSLKEITAASSITIKNNDALSSLSGLENLNSISGNLDISENNILEDISSLKQIQSVENLIIDDNNSLATLSGLENLNFVSGTCRISDNDALVNLIGLNNIQSIGGNLAIFENEILLNVTGLDNLNLIGGWLVIHSNERLSNLSGLMNLTEVGHISLSYTKTIDSGTQSTSFETTNENLTEYLAQLENIKIINGIFDIRGTDIYSFTFPKNIVSIGTLNIEKNFNLIDLTGLSNLSSVGSINIRSNPVLKDLSFLRNINVVDEFEIFHNNNLSDVSGLENLDTVTGNLEIIGNSSILNFKGLDNLQSIGGDFLVTENHKQVNFTGLEKLAKIDGNFVVGGGIIPRNDNYVFYYQGYFYQGNHALESFMGLNKLSSIGGCFKIAHLSALTSLTGLENLKSIGSGVPNSAAPNTSFLGLLIKENFLLKDLSGLNGLTNVEGPLVIDENISLTKLSGLENLNIIESSVKISNNDALTNISALNNISFKGIGIKGNNSLSNCNTEFFCSYIEKPDSWLKIENNYFGCNSISEIQQNCQGGKISIQFFYDLNQNKIYDSNEPYASFGSVILNPDDIKIIQNPKTGYGIWFATPGKYTVTIDEASIANSTLTTDSVSYQLNLSTGGCDVLNFGVYPNQPISEMRSFMYSSNARCNTAVPFDLLTKNWGTTNTKGILWFKADANISSFSFIDEPDTLIEPNQYGWFFEDLMPSEYLTKHLKVGIPSIGQVEVGQDLAFESFAEFTDTNGQQFSTSVFNYQTPVRCSYDPNDKLVNPNRQCNHILTDENLTYTIRFQNTGNDVAFKVSITDKIDANLDLNTFSLINSSHIDSLQTSITDDGTITFEFNNINLPDSTTSLEGSNGYVMYSIQPKTGLPENTVIKNTSAIYFDFNPPIITNTVESILVNELPNTSWCRDMNNNGLGNPNEMIESCEQPEGYVTDCSDLNDLVSVEEESINHLFNIYPNPTNGIFKIHVADATFKQATLSLFNAQGQQVVQPVNLKQNQHRLNYPDLVNGVYYLTIQTDDLIFRKKLMEMK